MNQRKWWEVKFLGNFTLGSFPLAISELKLILKNGLTNPWYICIHFIFFKLQSLIKSSTQNPNVLVTIFLFESASKLIEYPRENCCSFLLNITPKFGTLNRGSVCVDIEVPKSTILIPTPVSQLHYSNLSHRLYFYRSWKKKVGRECARMPDWL